jgi:hypothetical protein
MKCIKSKADGTIKRVTDVEAFQMVGSKWNYASKSEWKQATRVVVEVTAPAVVEETTVAEKQLKRKKKK